MLESLPFIEISNRRPLPPVDTHPPVATPCFLRGDGEKRALDGSSHHSATEEERVDQPLAGGLSLRIITPTMPLSDQIDVQPRARISRCAGHRRQHESPLLYSGGCQVELVRFLRQLRDPRNRERIGAANAKAHLERSIKVLQRRSG
jgi:hypothetical protein